MGELFTGENKIDFEHWFSKKIHQVNIWEITQFNAYDLELFYSLPFDFQIGVIMAYYHTLGKEIEKTRVCRYGRVSPSYKVAMIDYESGEPFVLSASTPDLMDAYKHLLESANEEMNRLANSPK